jgi:hypothetical protein
MASVFGVFDAQSFVILVVALLGLVPVVLYHQKTPGWFVVAYGFLFIAAFATNFEDLFLPTVLNLTEHFIGNLGAGLAFAGAAYLYRKERIKPDDDSHTASNPEV